MMSDYVPIACDAHSVLELLAMRRAIVSIEYDAPPQGVQRFEGTAVDILVADAAEHLVLEIDGQRQRFRLDRLRAVFNASQAVFVRQEIDASEEKR